MNFQGWERGGVHFNPKSSLQKAQFFETRDGGFRGQILPKYVKELPKIEMDPVSHHSNSATEDPLKPL